MVAYAAADLRPEAVGEIIACGSEIAVPPTVKKEVGVKYTQAGISPSDGDPVASNEHVEALTLYTPFESKRSSGRSSNSFDMELGRRAIDLNIKVNDGRSCPMAILADRTVSRQFGTFTESRIISVLNDLEGLYVSLLNVTMPIVYMYVVRSESDPSGLSTPNASTIYTLLDQLQQLLYVRNLPSYPARTICLNHLFTYSNFWPIVGLAYVQGICSGGGYNSGASTFNARNAVVNRATLFYTMSHEIGHNFGSSHDSQHPSDPPGNPPECTPNDPYLMYPYITSASPNIKKFSPCSLYEIQQQLQQTPSTCMTKQGAEKVDLKAGSAPNLWFNSGDTTYFPTDQCQLRGSILPGNSTYTTCPFIPFGTTSCQLYCINPDLGSNCLWFRNVTTGGPVYLKDGTLCGESLSQSIAGATTFTNQKFVCKTGQCVQDTRTKVCDRSQLCCDEWGEIRPEDYMCRVASSRKPCRFNDFCPANGTSLFGTPKCPYTVKPPGTRCVTCPAQPGESSCIYDGICGWGANLGECINRATANLATMNSSEIPPEYIVTTTQPVPKNVNSSVADNPLGLCSLKQCATTEECVLLGGSAICATLKYDSCRYNCNNTFTKYFTGVCSCMTATCGRGTSLPCCNDIVAQCGEIDPSAKIYYPPTPTPDPDPVLFLTPVYVGAGVAGGALAVAGIVAAGCYLRKRRRAKIGDTNAESGAIKNAGTSGKHAQRT
ncbi:hypothetical protein BJ742DRAFT_841584 [Cladochytrium replicatum]|nr:hypothetical protein BJ742DRAFT_841584 [Cladochytrium replicatum]